MGDIHDRNDIHIYAYVGLYSLRRSSTQDGNKWLKLHLYMGGVVQSVEAWHVCLNLPLSGGSDLLLCKYSTLSPLMSRCESITYSVFRFRRFPNFQEGWTVPKCLATVPRWSLLHTMPILCQMQLALSWQGLPQHYRGMKGRLHTALEKFALLLLCNVW